jgi:serine/threonine protein kinase
MKRLPYLGSTADFFSAGDGVVIKSPMSIWSGNENRHNLEAKNVEAISIERRILEELGHHPRIVPFVLPRKTPSLKHTHRTGRYLGPYGNSSIQLREASHGTLQVYLETYNAVIEDSLRYRWCIELAEGFAYIHSKGVIHSDVSLNNVLVNAEFGLWLCDFGGSKCDVLGLYGGHLPDDPFFDPRLGFVSTPATDIFGLGSLLFVILTGNLPFGTGLKGAPFKDLQSYEAYVNNCFGAGQFPVVDGLTGGEVIRRCWHHNEDFGFKTTAEVVSALRFYLLGQH